MKAIETKYLPATNFRGSRIRAAAEGGNSVTLSYDSEFSSDANHARAALELARQLAWKGRLIMGHTAKGCVFVFSTGDKFTI
jgi:hypothetical protein